MKLPKSNSPPLDKQPESNGCLILLLLGLVLLLIGWGMCGQQLGM